MWNNKGNATVITIIVVVVVIIAGLFFFSNKTNGPVDNDDVSNLLPAPGNEDVDEMIVNGDDTELEAPDIAATVIYTNDGFSPKSVEIKRGETVMFVNESTQGMWVASALHPTHEVYPEQSANDCLGSSFDACEQLTPGSSWAFTFDSAGEWGYHNHARPGDTGKVIVE